MISEIFGFVCEPIVHILGTERSQRRGHIAVFLSLRPFFRLYLLLLFLFQSIFNSINTIFRAFSLHKLFLRRRILRRQLLLRFFLRRLSRTRDFVEGVFVVFQLAVLPANPLPGQIAVGFQLVQCRPDGGNPILGDGSQPGDGKVPLRRKAEDDGKQADGFQGQPGIPEVLGTHHREIPVFWCSHYWHCSSPFEGGDVVFHYTLRLFMQKSALKR